MNTLLIYMVKTAVYLAGFYLIFFIFLSKDTKYIRNRAFILMSVISAFLLPLISVNVHEASGIYYFGKTLSEVLVTAESGKGHSFASQIKGIDTSSLLLKIYLTGVIVFVLKLFADLINLSVLIVRNKKLNEHIIYFKGFNTSGFSAMGYIFINRALNKADADEIIRHEQNHLDNNHFIDILFIEIALIFQWFNPFIYLINRSLRAIHEYQADQQCLKSGMPVTRYQNLLLNNVFKSQRVKIYNSFSNPSLLRKRMTMMVKEPSGNSSSLKMLLVIPVILLFLLVISACEKSILISGTDKDSAVQEPQTVATLDISQGPVYTRPKSAEVTPASPPPPPPVYGSDNSIKEINEEAVPAGKTTTSTDQVQIPGEIFVVVEDMPVFPGGDAELMKFINSSIIYPQTAKEKNIEGRVILRFAVMANGKVDNVQVLKPVDPSLDEEAIRVVKSLPDWQPGRQAGKPVNVWYSVPINFALK